MNRNRRCALAVAIAALWTAAEARGNALWQLPEDERHYLLRLAGGDDHGENKRSGYFRSSAGRPMSFGICRLYVEDGKWAGTSQKEKHCFEELPPMVLKRIHEYGYKDVRLEDVANLATYSFYKKMRQRAKNETQEESNRFLRGYLAFKKRVGVYTTRDRTLEDSLKPPKTYIIKRR